LSNIYTQLPITVHVARTKRKRIMDQSGVNHMMFFSTIQKIGKIT